MSVIEAIHYGNKSLKTPTATTPTSTVAQSTCSINPLDKPKEEILCKEPNQSTPKNDDMRSPTSTEPIPHDNNVTTSETKNNQRIILDDSSLQKKIVEVIRSSKHPLGCSMCELSACIRTDKPTDPELLLSELNRLIDQKIVHCVTDSPGRFKLTEYESDIPNSLCSESEVSLDGVESTTETSLNSKTSTRYSSLIKSISHESIDTSSEISSYPLSFTYVDENDNLVVSRQNAHQREYTIDEEKLSGYRIRCIYEDLIVSGLSYRIDWSRSQFTENDVSYTLAYLLDPNAPKLSTNQMSNVSSVNNGNATNTLDSSHEVKESKSIENGTTASTTSIASSSSTTTTTTATTTAFTFKPVSKVNTNNTKTAIKRSKSQEMGMCAEPTKKLSRNNTVSSVTETSRQPVSPTQLHPILARQLSEGRQPQNIHSQQSSSHKPLSVQSTNSTSTSTMINVNLQPQNDESTPLSSRIIPGGSYEIILLADVRENFGSNKVRQMLPTVFQKYNIKCESRALPVGDFLWVARWRDKSDSLMEAVLDQIVERKRMDDLAHSIVDGRFTEQKYRLKRTGLLQPIYLIEECSTMHNQKVAYDVLIQAISNTQVIDGFQVMTSRGPEDTVDLLAMLSRRLQSRGSNDLIITNHKSNDTSSKLNTTNAMGWGEFVKLANKSPDPTVRDVFAKHLLQIPGCSGPKITSILQNYPTPSSLMDAYDTQLTSSQKDNMLASLKPSDGNRCFGAALSRRISLAYNTL
ncbi:unnamed protein product [Trichobilharzia szidati]|nr:unnamed protein product [Trichobilharzia szidati]